MYQTIKKFLWLITLCFLLSVFSFSNTTSVSAASSDEIPKQVTDATEGIVQLILSCTDTNGNTYYVHQGTGFVAGFSEDTPCILTTNQIVTATETELSQIRKWGGLSSEDALTTQISVLLAPDVLIPLNVTSLGSDVPYALLTPSQKLSNVSALRFNFVENIARTQSAYLYGYSSDMSILGQTSLPHITPEFQSGSITEISSSPLALSCDINAESGCSGAPLLDENGYVLGMFYSTNDILEVLPSDTILEILTTLNIKHETNSPNADYNVPDDAIKQELLELVSSCKQDVTENGETYSDKTLSSYMSAIQSAEEILEKNISTKAEYQTCIKNLQKAKKKLKPRNFTFRIIQTILLGVLLLLTFINIRQYLKSRNFYRTLHPNDTSSESPKQEILSGALIRRNTNEVIWLSKRELRIGSDADKVDYLISDNPAISRYHAAIIRKNGKYYIMDNHSTNHTSVNHILLTGQKPCLLKDNDFIMLADEPFVFRLM